MGVQTIVINDAGRIQLIDAVIAKLEASGDPRAPAAIAEYKQQRATVVQRMAATADQAPSNLPAEALPGQPPAQIVGMQSITLRGN